MTDKSLFEQGREPVQKQTGTTPPPPPPKEEAKASEKTTSEKTKEALDKKKTSAPPAVSKDQANAAALARMGLKEVTMVAAKQRYIESGGKPETFMKEASFAYQIISSNPYMVSCFERDKAAVINAIANVAQTGLTLNPTLNLAYLVPYKGIIKFQSSYMGKREVVMSTGMVKDAYAKLVFENDEFEVQEGTDGYIHHKANYFSDRGQLNGGYWVCIMRDGTKSFGVMPKDRIDLIRKRSPADSSGKGSPWDTDYEEMAKKTIFNWGYKSMPKLGISESVLAALEAEGKFENEMLHDWVAQRQKKDDFAEDAPPKGGNIVDITFEE